MKKTKNEESKVPSLENSTFVDKNKKIVKVSDIITKNDCWKLEHEGKWVVSHVGVQKIAHAAGISKTYSVEESTIMPTYKNGQEHIVRVKIQCTMKNKSGNGCVHDIEDTVTVTGEANRENTSSRGRVYLRKMAEKRAYDIAVLQHLGLYMTIYSEEESDTYIKPGTEDNFKTSISIMNTDIEYLREDIHLIVKTKNIKELAAAWTSILKPTTPKPFTPVQLNFLTELYNRQKVLITNGKIA